MRVVVSANNVVNYPRGGGHFWVFMQYVRGLENAGCDVWWLEEFEPSGDAREDALRIDAFAVRLARYGLQEKVVLYTRDGRFLNLSEASAKAVFRDTDLLLNFHQNIAASMLERFRRTALVDIDPGLLQYWMSSGALTVARHDVYLTTGETVGMADAKFPDCGLRWNHIRPPVSLELWPWVAPPADAPFTTVSGWWAGEWVEYGGEVYDNNKRASFLRFVDLPERTDASLELALNVDLEARCDAEDFSLLESKGWRVRHAHEVAGTPEDYQKYIQGSRGEFSCAKASCMKFQNAWISDRTLCYLATGRPAVVEYTGPSAILPNGLGLIRFSSLEEAAAGLAEVAGNYAVHARAARELADLFDARRVAETIMDHCLQPSTGLRR